MRVACVAALLLAGCGDAVMHVSVDDGSPAWVTPATVDAIAFWDEHQPGLFVLDDGREVVVRVDVDDTFPDHANAPPGEIVLSPELEERGRLNRRCTIAHELGHSIGMRHVGGGSLMSPVLAAADAFTDCAWSDQDETELARALRGSVP